LGYDDFADGVLFPDVVGLVSEVDRRMKPFGRFRKPGNIPLGILVSEDLPNVIVGSAKNPSTEKPGMMRGQVGCFVLGQGAGVAATEAVKHNTPVHAVDITRVQAELRRQRVILDV
jgi:hypothetical protein